MTGGALKSVLSYNATGTSNIGTAISTERESKTPEIPAIKKAVQTFFFPVTVPVSPVIGRSNTAHQSNLFPVDYQVVL
ncbi:hypothetical protein RRG08_014576 [Elysia crispata]|uniref:Uncharacterized protein n=1 Tax=Elysia crispata TaxID=231223 RepID=A0AAE0YMP5_9GAST|nr:hypothetical protein RRG08_014576 [Elysia crispata]